LTILAAAESTSVHGVTRGRRVGRAVIVLIAAGLIAVLAFLAGEHHQGQVNVLRGVAGTGDHLASIAVPGSSWVYGTSGVEDWIDQQGQTHNGGWPACLSTPGKAVPIKFGWLPATGPNGSSWRQVVWVDCRA
jgi:hypothetical protein